jgi:hypothetical protein
MPAPLITPCIRLPCALLELTWGSVRCPRCKCDDGCRAVSSSSLHTSSTGQTVSAYRLCVLLVRSMLVAMHAAACYVCRTPSIWCWETTSPAHPSRTYGSWKRTCTCTALRLGHLQQAMAGAHTFSCPTLAACTCRCDVQTRGGSPACLPACLPASVLGWLAA